VDFDTRIGNGLRRILSNEEGNVRGTRRGKENNERPIPVRVPKSTKKTY